MKGRDDEPRLAPAAHSNSTAEGVSPALPGRETISMPQQARHDRQWMHWPDDRDAGMRGRLRSLFAPTDAGDDVTELIAVHGRQLEERSAELVSAAGALELREARAKELHAKVERVLREGAVELDVRQTELEARAAELDRREAALVESERRLEARRRELGAVELRGAAVARREEALQSRESELELRAGELADLARQLDAVGTTFARVEQPAVRRRRAPRVRGRRRLSAARARRPGAEPRYRRRARGRPLPVRPRHRLAPPVGSPPVRSSRAGASGGTAAPARAADSVLTAGRCRQPNQASSRVSPRNRPTTPPTARNGP